MQNAPHRVVGAFCLVDLRWFASLPHPVGCSTFAVVGLSFRVRNGTGRFPHAMTTAKVVYHGHSNPFGVFVFGLVVDRIVVVRVLSIVFVCFDGSRVVFGLVLAN